MTVKKTTHTEPSVEENGDTEAKKNKGVEYTLEPMDELPARLTGARESVYEQILRDIRTSHELHNRWVVIAKFEHSTAATAAKNVLGKRHGKKVEVRGWEFATRRIDEGLRTALFAKFSPDKVIAGEYEKWVEYQREHTAELAEARAAKG